MTDRSFRLDRSNRKIMGVAAGLADHSGIDVLLVRLLFVLALFVAHGGWVIAAYLLVGLLARDTARG